MINSAHHYCDVYDSLQQKKNVEWGDPLNKYYLGRLRLDTLLARKTIIKDAELFNGRFFLSVTETEDLFKKMPLKKIEIRSRSENLEDALVELFAPPGADRLNGIILQALREEEANEARERLQKIPSRRVTDRKSLCRVLKEEAGIDRTWVDRFDRAWSRWIELSTKGELTIATWRRDFDFKTGLTEQLDQTKQETFLSLKTELGKELAKRVYEDGRDRGNVVEHVRKAQTEANENETEQKDIATVSSWHSAAYNRSVAVHHDCGMVEITDDPGSRPIDPIREFYDAAVERLYFGTSPDVPAEITGNISPAFLEALSTYPTRHFDLLIEKHETNLNAWHDDKGKFGMLARAVNDLVEQVDTVGGFTDAGMIPDWVHGKLKVFTGVGKLVSAKLPVVGKLAVLGITMVTKVPNAADKRLHVSRRIVRRAGDLKK